MTTAAENTPTRLTQAEVVARVLCAIFAKDASIAADCDAEVGALVHRVIEAQTAGDLHLVIPKLRTYASEVA